MELTITQKKVLEALYKNKNKWLSEKQIQVISGVNPHHITQALYKFYNTYEYVYCSKFDGITKFQISPEGESAYFS